MPQMLLGAMTPVQQSERSASWHTCFASPRHQIGSAQQAHIQWLAHMHMWPFIQEKSHLGSITATQQASLMLGLGFS
jgi:hypothetical protein